MLGGAGQFVSGGVVSLLFNGDLGICPRDSLAVLGQWIQGKLVQVCADVRVGPVFWQQMEIYDQLRGEPTIPEWLSTHPSHQNRVRQLDRLVPQALELRAHCDCPALPKADPRVIFHQAVKLLLDNAKNQEKIAQEERNEKQRAGVMLPLPSIPSCPDSGVSGSAGRIAGHIRSATNSA